MPYAVMETTKAKLSLIEKIAAQNRTLKFTSLIHLLNDEGYLFDCFKELERGKAAGVDTRTKESYTEAEIRQAIKEFVVKLKAQKYQPQPVRRVFIPKSGGTLRPLGIPTVMDKIVQLAVAKILTPLYEPIFSDTSYGYRPKRNAHGALKAVDTMIMKQKVNWIIDADIKGFFDNVDHGWMEQCLQLRISDPNFLTLVRRMLKAGVMTQGVYAGTDQGTPQGGIVSPILANIYLHYVLDLWFEKIVKPKLRGYAGIVRFADDFVIGCQCPDDAQEIRRCLKERLAKFALSLAEDKTRVIEFGRFAKRQALKRGKSKPATFTFLGFTHYCGQKKMNGSFTVKLRTSGKKYRESLKRMKEWMQTAKNRQALPDLWSTLALKLNGHYQYYGVSGNTQQLRSFANEARQMAFKWFNRRSQKKSWTWEQYERYLERYPLPKPHITYALYSY